MVETVRVEVPVPPFTSVIVVGFMFALGPDGETVAVRGTVPANPLMLVAVTADVADWPGTMVRLVGFAESVKSSDVVTVTPIVTE